MAGTIVVDRIESDGSYASTINVASKVNFTGGMQIGGQDTTFAGMRNRIINGAMTIDQRNGGASVAFAPVGLAYAADRFQVRGDTSSGSTMQQSNVVPAGFTNSYLITIGTGATPASSAYNYFGQRIEGYNISDLGWGTVNAQPATVSFWIRSSLTGTFGLSLRPSSGNPTYLTSYTINQANTWEYKTIVVPGATTGTWNTTNGIGILLFWDLGVGTDNQGTVSSSWQDTNKVGLTGGTKLVQTSGATMYITGVQFEKGSSATAFEQRMYGQELALCQRYFYNSGTSDYGYYFYSTGSSSDYVSAFIRFPVPMRANPTLTGFFNGVSGKLGYMNSGASFAATSYNIYGSSANSILTGQINLYGVSARGIRGDYTVSAEL
jgi:hypothetical protein